MQDDSYITVAATAQSEQVIRRSRFIGSLSPASTTAAARDYIARMEEMHESATHCCRAYRVGYPSRPEEYYSDAGEPAGTAGPPLLHALQRAGIVNTVIVVIRYFGGVKLGIRGLIDAYRHTADAVVTAATLTRRVPCVAVRMTLPYSAYDPLSHRIDSVGGRIVDAAYDAEVHVTAELPCAYASELIDAAHAAGARVTGEDLHKIKTE